MTICECGQHLAVGRMHQHICKNTEPVDPRCTHVEEDRLGAIIRQCTLGVSHVPPCKFGEWESTI